MIQMIQVLMAESFPVADIGSERCLFVRHGAPHITQPLYSRAVVMETHTSMTAGKMDPRRRPRRHTDESSRNLVFTFTERGQYEAITCLLLSSAYQTVILTCCHIRSSLGESVI